MFLTNTYTNYTPEKSLQVHCALPHTTSTQDNYLYLISRQFSEPPSHWEEKTKTELAYRLRFCEEMSKNHIFRDFGEILVDVAGYADQFMEKLKRPEYEQIYQDLFTDGHLTSEYKSRRFNISIADIYPRQANANEPEFVDDFVFPCLLQKTLYGDLVPVYVTKLYRADSMLLAHRFLLQEDSDFVTIMLAEAPAQVLAPPEFPIDAHYLDLKKENPVSSTRSLFSRIN